MADCTADKHGTSNAWRKHGCTCPQARADYLRQHKRTRVRTEREGKLRVDKTGTVRRVRALQAVGWPLRELVAQAGLTSVGALSFLSRKGTTTVHVDTARQWADIYDRLCTEDGPGDVRVRRMAKARGWWPPEAWLDLDIDNPAHDPGRRTSGRPPTRDAGRLADVAFLRSWGVPDDEIAARWGIRPGSLDKALRRAHSNAPATLVG